ncbi:MAG: hypothetical protein M3R37_06095 [Actinomycetota bacterium]|nr:hypothetical protein [Actinomycetota bacterium]
MPSERLDSICEAAKAGTVSRNRASDSVVLDLDDEQALPPHSADGRR